MLTFLPHGDTMYDTVSQRATIRAFIVFNRPRNTHKFDIQKFGRSSHCSVAMATHINESKVGRQLSIRLRPSLVYVTCLRVLETCTNPVMQQ